MKSGTENYPEKIDQFTEFAKHKLDAHTTKLSQELATHESVEFKDTAYYLHRQSFELELSGKIRELNHAGGILLEPLTLLKDYYVEIFENVKHG